MEVRPARPKARPSGSTISKSPSTRIDPLLLTVILAAAMRASEKGRSALDVVAEARTLDYAEFAGNSTRGSASILGHAGIDIIRPRQDAASKILNFAEAGFAQEIHGFRRAFSAAAMRHNFERRIQFVNAAVQFAERDQMSIQVANLKLVRFAHVQDEELIAPVETRF